MAPNPTSALPAALSGLMITMFIGRGQRHLLGRSEGLEPSLRTRERKYIYIFFPLGTKTGSGNPVKPKTLNSRRQDDAVG